MHLRLVVPAALVLIAAARQSAAAGADRDAGILLRRAQSTLDGDSSAVLYRTLLDRFPHDSAASWALLRLAQYSEARGDRHSVERFVAQLRADFPSSSARRESAALLPEISAAPNGGTPPAPPRSAAAPAHSAEAQPSGPYGVQLGVFSKRANADRVRATVHGAYTADIREQQNGTATVYVVTAGTFKTEVDATRALPSLERSTGLRGVVVKRK